MKQSALKCRIPLSQTKGELLIKEGDYMYWFGHVYCVASSIEGHLRYCTNIDNGQESVWPAREHLAKIDS